MKKYFVFLTLFICLQSFYSCSTDIELYADYKDVPIVYGIINTLADTNYVKITKAFCGNNDNPIDANEVALVYDSSNYPEKLKAYIIELKGHGQTYQPTGRKFILDTLTIHNKQEGTFYSPDQTLYYTPEQFHTGGYKYKLVIVKPDGDTVTATTTPIGKNIAILSYLAFFQSAPTNSKGRISFIADENAFLYEIKMRFNYREKHPSQPMVSKSVDWTYKAQSLSSFERNPKNEDEYFFYYSENSLFNALANAIGNDTLWNESHPNVTRYMDDFVVFLSAVGSELYESYETEQAMNNGLMTSFSGYTNIVGGYGLFSSCISIEKKLVLNHKALLDLYSQPWGFVME
jgi:hypothetical protein